eukprot:CAMPEP_0172472122 /NCGR_PEP_ID=MMETSP1065-20121228/68173_1 /TAXON_ID=265537 /ORGANISM="Amphiprora paludosa, Strain CCMP125" /LENGTH=147 /DNA_ID=CAMNT_0013230247 /DNA_START=261 /DNA_END=705 /DNA_ORIENTATION=-
MAWSSMEEREARASCMRLNESLVRAKDGDPSMNVGIERKYRVDNNGGGNQQEADAIVSCLESDTALSRMLLVMKQRKKVFESQDKRQGKDECCPSFPTELGEREARASCMRLNESHVRAKDGDPFHECRNRTEISRRQQRRRGNMSV